MRIQFYRIRRALPDTFPTFPRPATCNVGADAPDVPLWPACAGIWTRLCARKFSKLKLGWPTGFAPAQAPSQGAMLLLHHDQHKLEPLVGLAPSVCTRPPYKFTKLVLWLLRHRGKMESTAGLAPATSTFARWRSDLTELRGQNGIRDRTCTD